MDLELAVDSRQAIGKENKRLRREGIVPGVVFGKGSASVPVQVDAKTFDTVYRAAGHTGIVKISVDGGRSAKSVMIKEVQRNPLTGRAVHVDFFLVNLTQEMQADVPLVYAGEAPAIEQTGGTLLTPIDHIRVRALPADLPHEVQVDISPLVDLEAAIHVRDLVVDAKVTILNDPEELLAKVTPPRVEEEPEEVPAEEAAMEEAEAAQGVPEGEEGSAETSQEEEA